MSLVVGVKVKAEGLTTALQALSLVWPTHPTGAAGGPVLAELNPLGGDLALRYGLLGAPNLVSLASADSITARLPGSFQALGAVSLLLAPPSAEQTQAALGRRWGVLARELSALPDRDVLVDAGLLVAPDAGNGEVLEAADVGVVVARPTLDSVVHLLRRLPAIARPSGGLVVLLVGEGPISAAQVEGELGLAVVGQLPWDREGAAMLMSGQWSQRALRRSTLLRWATNISERLCALVADLAVDPGPGAPPRPAPVPATGAAAR